MSSETIMNQDHLQLMREEMHAAYNRRDYSEALELTFRILQHMPDDDDALFIQASCHFLFGNDDEAMEGCSQLLAINPKDARYTHFMGQIYLQMNKWNDAESMLKQALELSPSVPAIHCDLAKVYFYQWNHSVHPVGISKPYYYKRYMKSMKLAEQSILKAIELQPGDAYHHMLYGSILDRQVRDEEAEIQYREAIQLDPMLAIVHCRYGRLLYYQGRVKEARDHIEQALMLDATDGEALAFGQVLDQFESNPKAAYRSIVNHLRERVGRSSNPAPVYLTMAKLMLEGDGTPPVKELRAYLKLVPDDVNAKLLYGQALFKDWRYFHAKYYFKKLSKQYPDNVYAEQWYEKSKKVGFLDNLLCLLGFLLIRPLIRFLNYIVYPVFILILWIVFLFTRRKGGVQA